MLRKVSCKNPVCGSNCFAKTFDDHGSPIWACANCSWETKRITRSKAGMKGLTKSQIKAMRRIVRKCRFPYYSKSFRSTNFSIKEISVCKTAYGVVYLTCRNGAFCNTYNLDRFHFAIGPKGGLKDLNN